MGILGLILSNAKNMHKAKNYRKMKTAQLLALDDEAFYDAVACVCNDAVYDLREAVATKEQKQLYCLLTFEAEVNNGGLCQFFVNESRACAPYLSDALEAVGATRIRTLYNRFLAENSIDAEDLSSFRITRVEDFEAQAKRYDFDRFDDLFYQDADLHKAIIAYARNHVSRIFC